jgi:ligand-binding sensor domain-containing protein
MMYAVRCHKAILVASLLLFPPSVLAQQLPIRRYDLRDGLAHSHVAAIHQDTKGYLWFGTWEGLSRFDGYRFTNYDTRHGLGNSLINAIAEDRHGRLWVATNGGGVSCLVEDSPGTPSLRPSEPAPGGKFKSFRVGQSTESNRVNALVFDSANNLWAGGRHRDADRSEDRYRSWEGDGYGELYVA